VGGVGGVGGVAVHKDVILMHKVTFVLVPWKFLNNLDRIVHIFYFTHRVKAGSGTNTQIPLLKSFVTYIFYAGIVQENPTR
jgi:hypothetical protein